jgi:hypothetical protein
VPRPLTKTEHPACRVIPVPPALQQLGFYFGTSGAHAGRALMLDDLRVLLDNAPASATNDWYSHAILLDNVLAKATLHNRDHANRRMRQLYGLDERICLFRNFRRLWRADAASRPVLAVLLAMARDALFRKSAELIVATPVGAAVTADAVQPLLDSVAGGRMGKETLRLACGNVLTSWGQAGYLTNGKPRLRARPAVGPAACAFALFLGWLEGARGTMLFGTRWAQVLGLPADELIVLAGTAARKGFMELLHAGGVIEVRFPGYLNEQEAKLQ